MGNRTTLQLPNEAFFGAYELNFAVKCKNICLTIFHKAHPCESGDVMQYALVVESDETSSDQIR